MDGALAWLDRLMTTLGHLFPCWVHVEYSEVAVSVTRGTVVRDLPPGLYMYWPLWTSIYKHPRVKQIMKVAAQPLRTGDGKEVGARMFFQYELVDSIQSLIETDDVDEALVSEAESVLLTFVASHDLETLQTLVINRTADEELLDAVSDRIEEEEYGVRAKQLRLTYLTTARPVFLLGDKAAAFQE